jgi:CDP-2,3-bis-(O-geranylgeranyl)-sn-glycerol synthase
MKLIGISTCINDGLPGLFWMDAQSFILGLAFIFPAYVSNATPVVVVRFLARRHPIDFGRVFVDGRRVLGDGKTFEGLFSGTAAGFLTGALIHLYTPWLVSLSQALLLSLGALLGDIAGAFIKRRLGISQGGPAPILDQLGFLVAALTLTYLLSEIPPWLDAYTLLSLMLFTALMHVGTNTAAYLLGLKDRWF